MEEIRGPGYRIVVASDLQPVMWDKEASTITVSRLALELDARFSLLGEVVASLLLPPVEASSDWTRRVIDEYRARITAEQAADLASRIGGVSGVAVVEPAFFPVSRARMYWSVNGCLLRHGLDPEALNDEYERYITYAGSPVEGGVRIRSSRFRETIRSYTTKLRAMTVATMARLSRILAPVGPWPGNSCDLPEPPDPSRHVRLPEGAYYYSCDSGRSLASRVLGAPARCRAASWTASSLLCEAGHKRIVVKEYMRMILKWLPAAAVSTPYYGYQISPKARLYNEYRYLRILRGVVETPRILAVCGTQSNTFMAREFVEGTPTLSARSPEAWASSGVALGMVHNSGHALGDPNPGNFVVGEDRVYVIDAEQAGKLSKSRAAWDIAVYTVYALLFRAEEDLIMEGLRAYKDTARGVWQTIEPLLSSKKFWAVFAAAPNLALRAKRVILEA